MQERYLLKIFFFCPLYLNTGSLVAPFKTIKKREKIVNQNTLLVP